jgi:hypothetical protein
MKGTAPAAEEEKDSYLTWFSAPLISFLYENPKPKIL